MRKILFATHGTFAEGIRTTVELILGPQENLSTLCCYTTPEFDLQQAMREQLNSLQVGDELIVMTDVAGGSVNNGFMTLLGRPGIHVVTGLNFPMAVEMLTADEDEPVAQVIARVVEAAKEGILYCNETVSADDEEF